MDSWKSILITPEVKGMGRVKVHRYYKPIGHIYYSRGQALILIAMTIDQTSPRHE